MALALDPMLRTQIDRAVKRRLNGQPYQAFYFGSRVRGDNFDRADIDIGIDGPASLPATLQFAILDDLETLPTLLKFDLVDFYGLSPSFREHATASMELIV